jgi:hypothetical protein
MLPVANGIPVARGLAPVRLRSSRNSAYAVCLKKRGRRFWVRFATQRGQVPSPQGASISLVIGERLWNRAFQSTASAFDSAIRKGRRFVLYLPLETL